MFTLTTSRRSLATTRDFAQTQATGLIYKGLSAESFTEALQFNAQSAYEKMEGVWPLPIGELQKTHQELCRNLQKTDEKMPVGEVLKYEASCGRLKNDVADSNTSRDRITALAEHTARCEGMELFRDHNSTVHRLALEGYMDMFLGKAQRPAVDQNVYLEAVEKAQAGNSKPLAKLIEENQEAGMRLQEQTQRLGPDYSVSYSLGR